MTKYHTHGNPLIVRCADCHEDITLHAQYIFDCKVLCGECNEKEGGEEDNYEEN